MHPTLALWLPAAAPASAAILAAVLPWRPAAWLSVLGAAGTLTGGIALAADTDGGASVSAGLVRADALTSYLLITVGAVALIACIAGIPHLHDEAATAVVPGPGTERSRRRYLVLVQLFVACMSMAVLANNLGVLWVAVEATTIVTAFLVGHRRTRNSVEAAWKYVVLCSVGIAIAFLGTVCVYAAAVHNGAHALTALDWTYLHAHAANLDPNLIRLATGLILLGFGTKAGLAPMHSWLPDAHSQAPAPVSALMSGVLLSVAFYAIIRYKTITDITLGVTYSRTLLLVAAFASLAVAALLLIAQRDYKRMLAYSSIEHMGLIALGTAIGGPLAMAAVLLHILGHGLAKAVAFCTAGRILHTVGSPRIEHATGLTARTPATAGVFAVSLLALLGLPPFALFTSELGIARAGINTGHGWAIAIAYTLLLVAYAAIARHGATMLLGTPEPSALPRSAVPASSPPLSASPTRPGRQLGGLLPLTVALAGVAALGLWLGPIRTLLTAAAHIAAGP